jgi:hypothetical protein
VFLTAAERTLSRSELYPFERFTESAKLQRTEMAWLNQPGG